MSIMSPYSILITREHKRYENSTDLFCSTMVLNTNNCFYFFQALAVTLTKFFLEPLEHVGQGISKLISGTLQHLPVHLWPFALGFLCFMTFLLLILAFGYRIKLFHLFGIEPGKATVPQKSIEQSEEHKQLRSRVEELTCQVSTNKSFSCCTNVEGKQSFGAKRHVENRSQTNLQVQLPPRHAP